MPEFADKAFMESYSEYIKNNFIPSGGGRISTYADSYTESLLIGSADACGLELSSDFYAGEPYVKFCGDASSQQSRGDVTLKRQARTDKDVTLTLPTDSGTLATKEYVDDKTASGTFKCPTMIPSSTSSARVGNFRVLETTHQGMPTGKVGFLYANGFVGVYSITATGMTDVNDQRQPYADVYFVGYCYNMLSANTTMTYVSIS